MSGMTMSEQVIVESTRSTGFEEDRLARLQANRVIAKTLREAVRISKSGELARRIEALASTLDCRDDMIPDTVSLDLCLSA